MKNLFSRRGFTYFELILSLVLFLQILFIVSSVTLNALKTHANNRKVEVVNTELYAAFLQGVGTYVKKSYGIHYTTNEPQKEDVQGTFSFPQAGVSMFNRDCPEITGKYDHETKMDTLSLFTNREKTEKITFAVERSPPEASVQTSRLIYEKSKKVVDDFIGEPWRYLHSENTYITCFLVSPSKDPYTPDVSGNPVLEDYKDVQPYVQLRIAAQHLDAQERALYDSDARSEQVYYRTLFTLRNYSYLSTSH